jgi:hypothetical protein
VRRVGCGIAVNVCCDDEMCVGGHGGMRGWEVAVGMSAVQKRCRLALLKRCGFAAPRHGPRLVQV